MNLDNEYSNKATDLLNKVHGGILKSKNELPEDTQGLHLEIDLNVYGLPPFDFDILVTSPNDRSEDVDEKLKKIMVYIGRYLTDKYNF